MDMTEERRKYWQNLLNPFWISTQDGTLRFRKSQNTPDFIKKLEDMGYTPTFMMNDEFEIKVVC